LKLAFYWAASCGGCEISVLDIDEKILEVTKSADIVFWPVAMDIKYKDVQNMPDKYIDVGPSLWTLNTKMFKTCLTNT